MSYLNALRLHFAGQFQANVSTVNNDPAHFYNAKFIPDYQKMEGPGMNPANGWFNPQGDAAFRLRGCRVTSAWTASGPAADDDPVLHCMVADSDEQAPAKLVDLDTEQQLVSEIWGLQVRVADAAGATLLQGDFAPAAFADIWDRATGSGGGGDIGAGAMYQSVLTKLSWGDVSASPFLTKLQAAAGDGLLSIKFNVDGLNMNFKSPDFMCGRIVGTIGPTTADEPRHMVIGRQFMAEGLQFPPPQQPTNFFRPAGQLNFCAGRLDSEAGSLFIDLGNALSTVSPGGTVNDFGTLAVTAVENPLTNPQPVPLGTIPSQGKGGYASGPDWYRNTAGVVELKLKRKALAAAQGSPLVILGGDPRTTFICEWSTGAFVRADRYVYRLSPREKVQMPVYATQWGEPLAGAVISFEADPSNLQPSSNIPDIAAPTVATPAKALRLPNNATATTDTSGRAVLTLTPGDPGTPRYFNGGADYGIDGQVYGIRPAFADKSLNGGPVNQWNFISILLWSDFKPSNPVTWADVQPIFQQYANLYPVMNRFLDLSDYDSVVKNAGLLRLAFGLDPGNPNVMPVTRDLSPAKRDAILAFLENPRPAKRKVRSAVAATVASAVPHAAGKTVRPSMGGKTAAAARRLIMQKK